MPSYPYRKSHCGDKTMIRSSYLHNGICYTGKMSSLYWFGPLTFNWVKVTWQEWEGTTLVFPIMATRDIHHWHHVIVLCALVGCFSACCVYDVLCGVRLCDVCFVIFLKTWIYIGYTLRALESFCWFLSRGLYYWLLRMGHGYIITSIVFCGM